MHTHSSPGSPGEDRGLLTWDQGSPWGLRTERLGPGCPHFWAETCQGSYCWSGLQQALNPGPSTGPALVPRPMPTARDAERLDFLAARVLDKWACPSAARWERSEDPGRPGRRPMWVGLNPTAPFPRWQGHASPGSQREGPFLQDCGLRGPHVTALGLPGQGQNELSLPEAPETRESRGSHLDGYSGRLVTSEGGQLGARPLLWGFSPVPWGVASELKGHRAAGRPREGVGAPAGRGGRDVLLHAERSPIPPDKTAARGVQDGRKLPTVGASQWGRPLTSCPCSPLLCGRRTPRVCPRPRHLWGAAQAGGALGRLAPGSLERFYLIQTGRGPRGRQVRAFVHSLPLAFGRMG